MDLSDTKMPSAPVLDFRAEKWVYGGQSLGRVEGHVVLAPGLLPGESARVAVTRDHAGYREARPVEIGERSPERIEPRCPVFGRCGGCDYQHAGIEYQLRQKVEILREVFQRVGKLEAPEQIEIINADPWHYRNRVQLHIDRAHLGYRAPGSHKVVPLEGGCPIAAPRINETIAALKPMLRNRRWPRFLRSVELFTNGAQTLFSVLATDGGRRVARGFIDWLAEGIPGAAEGHLDYAAAGGVYRVGHASFFQTNRFLIERLVEAALEPRGAGDSALDLFAGVGLFTIPLARRFTAVAAVESGSSATRDLAHNAAQARVAVNVHRSNADLYLETLTHAPDFVLADPPRSGLGKNVVKQLARLQPGRVTIVSCDPSTLARDLAALAASGYRLERLILVDLFPQTFHIETVSHLVHG